MDKKGRIWHTAVQNKKAPAGRWGTHQGKAALHQPCFSWASSGNHWQWWILGRWIWPRMSVHSVLSHPDTRLATGTVWGFSVGCFGDFFFFNGSTNYSSGQQWIRISDNKGKSWSLFCLENRNIISLKKLGHVFVNSVFRIKKCTF